MKNKNKIVKGISIAGSIFLGGMLIFIFFQEKREKQLLNRTKLTTAVLVKKKSGSVKSPKSGKFTYLVHGKLYEFSQPGDFLFMNLGDTVLINYAIEDPSVARVKDKYYMKKYQDLKGN